MGVVTGGGGGGAAFNGGTITKGLEIDAPGDPNIHGAQLYIATDALQGNAAIDVEDPTYGTVFEIASFGTTVMRNAKRDVNVAYVDGGPHVSGDLGNILFVTNDAIPASAIRVDAAGDLIVQGSNAAPASADLHAKELAIWFDATDGAAKLMVKAKSANGTVVTGSLALA